ncbi:type III secretion system outer membrane ring subunit SctC [Paraburkholderia bryophila]|uniref:type III secretion system outer membrane ring subunit SctC n=1 Tax=Paraburkholderia bryophila TaxID=420952 RepID=UPI00234BD0D0|nr:type III secretion system outer membrane ring subunit SctC [Paraburkholderia bryophila]WCM20963.1 type III secretion system outer membrane ring subunit SctC [Paraburkholderia bryophila]
MAWALLPLASLALPGSAYAATPAWHGMPIHYAVNGAPLPDVLRDVLAVEGLNADIGRDVKGAVNGRFDDTPGNVFTQLTEAYGLVWYFDGKAMHVTTAADVRSRVIPFAPMTREAVASLLRNLDLDDARLPIRYSATTVKVAGPSRFVDAVAEAIDQAQRQTTIAPNPEDPVIRIFPLHYAQAQDIRYTVGSQERVMPGVASLLRQLMADNWPGNAPGNASGNAPCNAPRPRADDAPADVRAAARTEARHARGGPPPLPSLLGLGMASVPAGAGGAAAPLPEPEGGEPRAASPARRNIVADARTNAVIISDLASTMPNYERAIAMLDQPQELVEIDAVVIDVSSNAARSLGVSWGGANGRINGASGTASAPLSFGAAALMTPASAAAGLNLATLVGNSAQYLFAQLNALENTGEARVQSRPRVLTLNNTEAALTSRSSVYVRVAGNQAVDLYNIDTGLTLKVTPNIEASGEPRRNIRLNIQIDDGAFNTTSSVDGIPQVDNHSVVTQAIVRDGESLLIGGYQYERSERKASKVPVLGDVPYLGALFRDTETRHERLERLILITPRLMSSAGAGAPNVTLAGSSAASGAVSVAASGATSVAVIGADAATPFPVAAPATDGVAALLAMAPLAQPVPAQPVQPAPRVQLAQPAPSARLVQPTPSVEAALRKLAQPGAATATATAAPPSASQPAAPAGLPFAQKMPWEARDDR